MLAIGVHQLGSICRETTPDKLFLDAKGHVKLLQAESPASSRLNQLLSSNAGTKQQQPCSEAAAAGVGAGGCSVEGALLSCSMLVIFSRLRFKPGTAWQDEAKTILAQFSKDEAAIALCGDSIHEACFGGAP